MGTAEMVVVPKHLIGDSGTKDSADTSAISSQHAPIQEHRFLGDGTTLRAY